MKTSDIVSSMPKMKSGRELIEAMAVIPEYDEMVCNKSETERLIALSDLYRIYVPSSMSVDIYTKLYLALLRSLQKKEMQTAINQRYENHKIIQQQQYRGIIGGSDSFTIIGTSGIGKSSAIMRAIDLITENRVIEIDKPLTKIIPCVIVQCPFDSSVRGLLLETLRKVDETLGSDYYHHAIKARATTDMLIGLVSQVALNHIGMLIVDEIQNVVNSKNGKSLIGSLTQLINNSGISICMVGTPESVVFFQQAMQLARRSVGLEYNALGYDDYFEQFCKTIFQYQYVKHRSEITEPIRAWLFEHSSGLASVVVSLIHDAQEIAILSRTERLSLETLSEAYEQRLSLLHDYMQPAITHKGSQPIRRKKSPAANLENNTAAETADSYTLKELASKAKTRNLDMVSLVKEYFTVTEVVV